MQIEFFKEAKDTSHRIIFRNALSIACLIILIVDACFAIKRNYFSIASIIVIVTTIILLLINMIVSMCHASFLSIASETSDIVFIEQSQIIMDQEEEINKLKKDLQKNKNIIK